jgi:hypothetical protein
MLTTRLQTSECLYGIVTAADCKKALQDLLALNQTAIAIMSKETVGKIKNALDDLYRRGDSKDAAMSALEKSIYFPAIHESYVKGPNLAVPRTWAQGLDDIDFYLRYYLRSLETSSL